MTTQSTPADKDTDASVSSSELSSFEVAAAQAFDKLKVDANGYGSVPRDWIERFRNHKADGAEKFVERIKKRFITMSTSDAIELIEMVRSELSRAGGERADEVEKPRIEPVELQALEMNKEGPVIAQTASKLKLPTPVTWEVATVYRACDGRRYVNKRSAMNHSAVVFLRHVRCTCPRGGHHDTGCEPQDCGYHGWKYSEKIKASAKRLIKFWTKKKAPRIQPPDGSVQEC